MNRMCDRIGFAAVGRYNEFENLRAAGVRLADLRGYSYDRRDVTGRALANAYAQTLGAIFTEQSKPFEVEICVAEVGASPDDDEMYRLTYDGSVFDEVGVVAMGGQADSIGSGLRERHNSEAGLEETLRLAVEALAAVGGEGGAARSLAANQLEVAILDRRRRGRTFRRIVGPALTALLAATETPAAEAADAAAATTEPSVGEAPADGQTPEADTPSTDAGPEES